MTLTIHDLIRKKAKGLPPNTPGDVVLLSVAMDLKVTLEQITLRRGSPTLPIQVLAERTLDGYPAWEHAGRPTDV